MEKRVMDAAPELGSAAVASIATGSPVPVAGVVAGVGTGVAADHLGAGQRRRRRLAKARKRKIVQINEDADSPSPAKRAMVARKATSEALLDRLSRDPEVDVRRGVAYNEHAPGYVLTALAGDEDRDVRTEVAYNPATPPGTLKHLSDSHLCGAPTLGGTPCQRPAKEGGRCPDHPGVGWQPPAERVSAWRTLRGVAGNPSTPTRVLEDLVGDVRWDMSAAPVPVGEVDKCESDSCRNAVRGPATMCHRHGGDARASFGGMTYEDARTAARGSGLRPVHPGWWDVHNEADRELENRSAGMLSVNAKERLEVAGDPQTPRRALAVLADDTDSDEVREAVIKNPATETSVIWDRAKNDPNRRIQAQAQKRLGL